MVKSTSTDLHLLRIEGYSYKLKPRRGWYFKGYWIGYNADDAFDHRANQEKGGKEMKIKLLQVREATGEPYLNSDMIYNSMKPESLADRECFWVLHLNTQNELIEKELVAIGTLDNAIVHPREVFKKAIINSSCSLITVHNHPSGALKPSKEDIQIWDRLIAASKIIGIPIIDNLIISSNGYYSHTREEGGATG